MKAVTKYPGSKWRIADWIISFFPEHHSYLEAFFGSGAVLFNKQRSNIETVNDIDGDIVNLFEWIKKDPERLAHEIYYTPYARQIYDMAVDDSSEDSLTRAVNLLIRLNMGHGYKTDGTKVGWKDDVQGREKAYAANDWRQLPERIVSAAERLRGVQIENMPAIKLMERFNFSNVLIYLDPPYVLNSRSGGKQYKHEMDNSDHEEMLSVAKKHKGPVLISGYDSELYRSELKDWHCEEISGRKQNGQKSQELLWMNFEPVQQMCLKIDFDNSELLNEQK